MKSVISIVLCMLLLTMTACVKVKVHDEHKAATLGVEYLRKIMDKRYADAYNLFDDEFKSKVPPQKFDESAAYHENVLGNLLDAKLDYFMIIGTDPVIELIFTCNFEKVKNVPVHLIAREEGKSYKLTVVDVGYNYKVFGDQEQKRPKLRIDKKYEITKGDRAG
jgi:hypothetical protein